MAHTDKAEHAFISYVHEDSEEVDRLVGVLRALAVPVWKDTQDLWPGEDWRKRIRDAIQDGSLAFIACFSANSVTKLKTHMNEELNLAVEQIRLMQPGQVWLIPVRLDDCELPNFDLGSGRTLDSLQRIDLFGPKREENLARMIKSIMNVLGQSQTNAATTAAAVAGASEEDRGPLLAATLKSSLSDPSKQIEVEELFLAEVRAVIDALTDTERFPIEGEKAYPTDRLIVERTLEYDSLLAPLAHAAATLGAWGSPNHAALAARAMATLARTVETPQGGYTSLIELRRYAILPVLYAGGMGAIARRNGHMLAAFSVEGTVAVAERKLPIVAAFNPWRPFYSVDVVATSALAKHTVNAMDIDEAIQGLRQGSIGRFYTPISEHLFLRLRPVVDSFVLDEDEYFDLFCRAEAHFALLDLDWQLQGDNVPEWRRHRTNWTGKHVNRESHHMVSRGLAQDLVAEIAASRSGWWPLTGGAFGSEWERAEAAAEAYVRSVEEAGTRRL